VRHALRPFAQKSAEHSHALLPTAQVEPHLATINTLCDGDDAHAIIDSIVSLQTDDPWLAKGSENLAHGSPLAALWILRQQREMRLASLRECFQSEIRLVTNIVRHPEFAEGVRALLIDKDRNPSWQYRASRDVPPAVLDSFFTAPWDSNPLADL
jgi:enoyl-CoA hydratase/carnithine racemase